MRRIPRDYIKGTAGAACTEAKAGGTGKEVGPFMAKDRGWKPCALMQSLMVFEESTIRAVRPSRVSILAGSIS